MSKTEIASLGKFGLIEHLTKTIKLKQESSIKGAGEDASILSYTGKDTRVLVSSNQLLEGIHFDLIYMPMKHLGYKSAIVSFSDIYAMNGQPKQLILNLGISKRFSVEDIEDFYAGMHLACEQYEVDLIDIRISATLTGFAITSTCMGEGIDGRIVCRDGAKDTDLIFVSGDLGSSFMGLQLLEREKSIYKGENNAQPDFTGKEYLLERQLKPEARKDVIRFLAEENIIPTAMISVSDGLASDIKHICKQSNVGCTLFEERLPIDYQTAMMAEQFNMNVSTIALNGGEDYELLFTVPLHMHDKVSKIKGVHLIGHITKSEYGNLLQTRDGAEMEIKAQGWNASSED